MKILLSHIKELIQVRNNAPEKVSGAAMKNLPTLKNAWLLLEDKRICDFGIMDELPNFKVDQTIDCSGKIVLPTWCDSHTHIVYAGNREQEFVDRIKGRSYQEIADNGGGIINSAKKLQASSEEDLLQQSEKRLIDVMRLGTGAIEIKSGYGLTVAAELKMLRVIKKLKKNYEITICILFNNCYINYFCTEKLSRQSYVYV